MSNDLVRAEVRSVRTLRHGVGRFAEQIRVAGAEARGEVAALERKIQEAVERRRHDFDRCERELAGAQAALSQCRENCGGLQQRVREAAQRRNEAKALLDRARKAAQLVTSSQSDLLKVLQAVEAKVGQTASVASSALAELDGRLAAIPHPGLGEGLGGAVRGALVAAATAAEVTIGGPDLAHLGGNFMAALGHDNGLKDSSLTQMREEGDTAEKMFWADSQVDGLNSDREKDKP